MYTKQNLILRQSLRASEDLKKALDVFWNTFSTVTADNTVAKVEIIEVEVRVCKALFDPDEWSLKEAIKAAEEDWDHDARSKNANRMAKSTFEDSIFETIDLWTEGVTADEYVDFAVKLHDRITTMDNGKCIWADLDDIQSLWCGEPILFPVGEEVAKEDDVQSLWCNEPILFPVGEEVAKEEAKKEEGGGAKEEDEEEEDEFVAPLPTQRMPQAVIAAEAASPQEPLIAVARPAARSRRRTTVKLDVPLNPGGDSRMKMVVYFIPSHSAMSVGKPVSSLQKMHRRQTKLMVQRTVPKVRPAIPPKLEPEPEPTPVVVVPSLLRQQLVVETAEETPQKVVAAVEESASAPPTKAVTPKNKRDALLPPIELPGPASDRSMCSPLF
jgi:hypothetical protein